jgi:hypothetical protein
LTTVPDLDGLSGAEKSAHDKVRDMFIEYTGRLRSV